ncbi:hypothetical protein A3C89_03030 [Candidatus Kaiserbacteria bacterium RIFCSPHIGHO2_02_FULL_50_50]|uniref:Potassium transporter KefA n=1 Tax=Candidatus Kaiserbacteria bacterium RIFCSPHIGHO2_02_FULL_50_50 TaxID=1798492 RepID=A0A1F6DE38_9BACT|nr:MAG: hypothetical protein A3C89_03030 [Candidatus Kaiserbacteria bacterium RIFCSPHIGHO2_02_FULL_50_50]OGG88446.1 MAG: hypothetical protein A3G62_01675 [Candidatus Kaiserbacteria bacterium RIFCSPLOWO2_12_FULL_50_10]
MEGTIGFYRNNLFDIVGIVALTFGARIIFAALTNRTVRRIIVRGEGMTAKEERQREDTLIRIIATTGDVLIWLVALMFIVHSFGVSIAPIITATGIIGVAFGFGAQYLVRDVISGLFMILENQYRVGDIVCFDDTCGKVTDVSLRKTTLRDLEGAVHHVPHGSITRVANKSQEFSRIMVDVAIAYDTDLDHVERVVNEVGKELAQDPQWSGLFRSDPKYLRIHEFADSAMVIRVLGETEPGDQFVLKGELRKRLKQAFDKEGIKIPFPQRVIHTA